MPNLWTTWVSMGFHELSNKNIIVKSPNKKNIDFKVTKYKTN